MTLPRAGLTCVALDQPSRLFTVGRTYPVVGSEGLLGVVVDDLGHFRSVSLDVPRWLVGTSPEGAALFASFTLSPAPELTP